MNSDVYLSVIIVSYNTPELLKKCILSVKEELNELKVKGEIIVVDNGSQDGVREFLQRDYAMTVILNNDNVGFGKANNQGAKIARGKYLLFLNSDTMIEKRAFGEMINFLDQDLEIGVASCQLRNANGTVQAQGGDLPNLMTVTMWALFLDDLPILGKLLPSYQSRKKIKQTQEVGWVGGTAMFVRKKCWDEMGGFDKNIFMYGEDVELCYRVKEKGWKIAINPKTSIIHLGKGSGKGQARWVTGEVKGLLYLFSKHKSSRKLLLLKFILKLGMGLRWLIFGILGRNEQLREAYLEAYWLV